MRALAAFEKELQCIYIDETVTIEEADWPV
jgi:hypothetical protein